MRKNTILVERETIWIGILYTIGITAVFSLWQNTLLATSLAVLLWLVCIKFWHTKTDNILFVIGFLGGSLGEINAIQLGIWAYAAPSMFGIPFWLPLVWGETVVVFKRISEVFVQLLP